MTLYHYTCDHGRLGIGDAGSLIPPLWQLDIPPKLASWQKPTLDLIWMTDLDRPIRDALGLTSYSLGCDRTVFRYRVVDEFPVERWTDVRRSFPKKYRDGLESAVGAMPAHWFISSMPVSVVFDPVMAALGVTE